MNNTYEYIKSLLDRDITIVPCQKDEKIPATSNWSEMTLEESKAFWEEHQENIDNYNYAILPDEHQVIIDIDAWHKSGKSNKFAQGFRKEFSHLLEKTYQESSFRGSHAFFKTKTLLKFKEQNGVELRVGKHITLIYPSTGPNIQYLPVYDASLPGLDFEKLPEIPEEILEYFNSEKTRRKPKKLLVSNATSSSAEEIQEALEYIDPDISYNIWYQIGQCIYNDGQDFEVFDTWSAQGSKYKKGETAKKWKEFTKPLHEGQEPLTIATLFHIAMEYDYEPPASYDDNLNPPTIESIEKHLIIKDTGISEDEIELRQAQIVEGLQNKKDSTTELPHNLSQDYMLSEEFWTSCPSPIGWLTQQALKKQRKSLPGSTFMSFATLAGHIKSHSGTSDNQGLASTIYAMCLAPTSSGKKFPQQMVDQITQSLNISTKGIYSDFRSDKAIYKGLEKHGSVLYSIDEFTGTLKQAVKTQAQSYMATIPGILINLWSYTNRTFSLQGTVAEKSKEIIIKNPKLSLLAFSQPSCFKLFAKEEFIDRGFTQRFLFVIERLDPIINQDAGYSTKVPKEILDFFSELHNKYVIHGPCTNLMGSDNHKHEDVDLSLSNSENISNIEKDDNQNREESPATTQFEFTDEAIEVFNQLMDEQESIISQANQRGDEKTANINGKTCENAKKLAMAICDVDGVIDKDLAIWCCKFMRHQIKMVTEGYFNVAQTNTATEEQDEHLQYMIEKWLEIYSDSKNTRKEVKLSKYKRATRKVDSKGRSSEHYIKLLKEMGIMTTRKVDKQKGKTGPAYEIINLIGTLSD